MIKKLAVEKKFLLLLMFKYFQFSQDNEGKKDTLLAG
jgi:hypothetical protein